MAEIKILPLYFVTLNEAKCNWNALQLLFDAWNYSMNYYEVRGAEKVKKCGISISPISQAAKQKHYSEHCISEDFKILFNISFLVAKLL